MKRIVWSRICFAVFYVMLIGWMPKTIQAEPLVYEGFVEPLEVVDVGSSVRGIVASIEVERGEIVKKNEVIAKLASDVERAVMELSLQRSKMETVIQEKQVLYDLSLRKLERAEALSEKKLISMEELDVIRTDSRLAAVALEKAKEELILAKLELKHSVAVLDRMTIYSPVTGIVMERYLAPGEFVEDQPVVKIAQINKLKIEVFAPVEHLGVFKVGMRTDVTINQPNTRVLKAKVIIVDRIVDSASGTLGVRLQLPNPKYEIPAGIKCSVTFNTDPDQP